jgi:hypothetical protein
MGIAALAMVGGLFVAVCIEALLVDPNEELKLAAKMVIAMTQQTKLKSVTDYGSLRSFASGRPTERSITRPPRPYAVLPNVSSECPSVLVMPTDNPHQDLLDEVRKSRRFEPSG